MQLLHNILDIALEVAPWLVVGLALAGIIKGWIPADKLSRWLGGNGIGPIARGAVIGAPLPLCSCGSIPAGVALYRGGASRGATTSFMIGTPGIGVDSIILTYVLMGPFLTLARVISTIASAITTGLLVSCLPGANSPRVAPIPSRPVQAPPAKTTHHCPHDHDHDLPPAHTKKTNPSATRRTTDGLRYAFKDVLHDIAPWMAIGIILAGALVTLLPAGTLATYGSGWQAMILMAVIGIPLYFCAQAATPIAAAMIIAGVSPGTAMVFLLAAPMTSLATLAVFRKEFGTAAVLVFATSIAAAAVAAGFAVDALSTHLAINIIAQIGESMHIFPETLHYLALLTLVGLALLPLSQKLRRRKVAHTHP